MSLFRAAVTARAPTQEQRIEIAPAHRQRRSVYALPSKEGTQRAPTRGFSAAARHHSSAFRRRRRADVLRSRLVMARFARRAIASGSEEQAKAMLQPPFSEQRGISVASGVFPSVHGVPALASRLARLQKAGGRLSECREGTSRRRAVLLP